jgi:flagellin-like protein
MKANKKFIKEEKAVSAVIGVILMVAITVAIAATVYVYVSGMMGDSEPATPNIVFSKDDVNNRLRVDKADPNNVQWSDIELISGFTRDGFAWADLGDTVNAGDTIAVTTEATTMTLRYKPTNTLLGEWEFSD